MTIISMHTNEAGVAVDWPTTATAGGTITEVSGGVQYRRGRGTSALRVNRTSAADVYAAGVQGAFNPNRQHCGAFYLYVASLPTAIISICDVRFNTANNFEITLDQNGAVKGRQQNGSAQAQTGPALQAGSAYTIEWNIDSTANPFLCAVRVNGFAPSTATIGFAAETPAAVDYGTRGGGASASLYDLYFDDQWVIDSLGWPGLEGWLTVPTYVMGAGSLPSVTALTGSPVMGGFIT